MLSERRNTRAAHRFLSKAVTIMRNWPPMSITTDKLPSYRQVIERLKRDGQLSEDTRHWTSKYLNNIIEPDHGALKRVIKPSRGFQTMRTATATIKGFEIMRMIRRGHCLTCKPGVRNEISFVNRLSSDEACRSEIEPYLHRRDQLLHPAHSAGARNTVRSSGGAAGAASGRGRGPEGEASGTVEGSWPEGMIGPRCSMSDNADLYSACVGAR